MPASARGTRRRSGIQPELLAQRGLDAVAVEQLPLDLGCFDRFAAHHIDQDRAAILHIDMLDGVDLFADILEEPRLQRGKHTFIPTKMQPGRLLPAPRHEL